MRPGYQDPKEEHRKLVRSLLGKSSQDPLPANFHQEREHLKQLEKTGQVQIDVSVLDSGRVCKSFIVGKCPYELLGNTKENVGTCNRIHSEKYKLIYESAIEKGIQMPRHNFEYDYARDMKYFLRDCDERIRVAKERLDYTPANKSLLIEMQKKIDITEEKINLTKAELKAVIDQGTDFIRALHLTEELKVSVLQCEKEKKQYSVTLEKLNSVGQQKMQICEICGAYMLKDDSDRRLADHFMGRIHVAYAEIRTTLNEIEKKLKTA